MTAIRTILLAEDSPHDAEMAIDALRDAHLANPIVHVEDGVEALDYLLRRGRFADRPEGAPAVLLLDIKMPRMDGLEVLTELRRHEALKRLPVVILSSSREENDLARSWDLGVNAYVVKPVDVDLPGGAGREARAAVRARVPGARCVFVTGAVREGEDVAGAEAVGLKDDLGPLLALARARGGALPVHGHAGG